MEKKRKFYITTAISYPNGRPHMGHAYEAIATDAIARYHRLAGADVMFLTGTDEHGLKMVQTARAAGMEPRPFADAMAAHYEAMAARLNISHDRFVRTSGPAHYRGVTELWRRIAASGDIYLGRYEGWYSVRDEAFYDEAELVAGEDGKKLSPQGTPVEWTAENSYFFRLSAYADKLLEHYEKHPDFIQPDGRRNEVANFVRAGLRDLSVSRTSFAWGVPVPDDPAHVMYVWLDALTAYMTGVGFTDDMDAWAKTWPADVHIIGKDIVRFHAVYWPAFLMSAGLPLPKRVFGHGFVLDKGVKMSKSLGNVVDPLALADEYGVDRLRYFLLRDVPFGQDGSYSHEAIVTRTNADLANSFGNLAQRTLSLIYKNLDGGLPPVSGGHADDHALLDEVRAGCRQFGQAFESLSLSQGVEAWLHAVFACNQYIDAQEPWKLRKSDTERMMAVLATLFIAIRDLAICISPVIPESSKNILDQMGIAESERNFEAIDDAGWYRRRAASGARLAAPQGVFPRYVEPVAAA